jgi:hypothetical protein
MDSRLADTEVPAPIINITASKVSRSVSFSLLPPSVCRQYPPVHQFDPSWVS